MRSTAELDLETADLDDAVRSFRDEGDALGLDDAVRAFRAAASDAGFDRDATDDLIFAVVRRSYSGVEWPN
jgi:hypothetical protein